MKLALGAKKKAHLNAQNVERVLKTGEKWLIQDFCIITNVILIVLQYCPQVVYGDEKLNALSIVLMASSEMFLIIEYAISIYYD